MVRFEKWLVCCLYSSYQRFYLNEIKGALTWPKGERQTKGERQKRQKRLRSSASERRRKTSLKGGLSKMQMFFRLLFQMRRLNVQERTFRQPLLDAETGNEHRFRPLAQSEEHTSELQSLRHL